MSLPSNEYKLQLIHDLYVFTYDRTEVFSLCEWAYLVLYLIGAITKSTYVELDLSVPDCVDFLDELRTYQDGQLLNRLTTKYLKIVE